MERESMEELTGPPPPKYSLVDPEGGSSTTPPVTPLLQDDGRLVLDAQSKIFRVLSQAVVREGAPEHGKGQEQLSEDIDKRHGDPVPFLNIVIQVVGSRGDVQPFVALGSELLRRGHRVRLATHNTFSEFVRKAGLEFYPIGGDPAELMAYMVKNPGLIPRMSSLREGEIQKKRKMVAQMLDGCWRSCLEPDPVTARPFVAEAIIANPPSFAHIHCAQALGVPLHLMFTMPWSSTSAFPHPLANIELGSSPLSVGVANYVSYLAVEWMTWQGLGDLVNSWRQESLGLDPVPASEGPRLAETLRIPFTYCWSPALIPKPADWPPHVDVCGFFFREPPQYDPPPELAEFLRRGPPPVYIGFGSIVIDDPTKLTTTILQAVKAVGVRAIVSRGWSNLGGGGPDEGDFEYDKENIQFIGDCPHDWLFQHVAAVIHHGGAGTTACGLLNGCPTAVVPFFGDQPFWGAMVAAAGGGPPPIPQQQLNSDNLAEAIRFCLRPEASAAAERLGSQMRKESGVAAAVDSFHAHLPSQLRCDILGERAAAWVYRRGRTRLRLSKLAAEMLVDNFRISQSSLSRYDPVCMVIDSKRWDPITGTTSSLVSTFKGLAVSSSNIIVKPIQVCSGATRRSNRRTPSSVATHDTPNVKSTANSSTTLRTGTIASQSPSQHGQFQDGNVALLALAGSAAGVGGFFKYFFRGMLVEMPLAATEGLRSLPGWYGGQVRDIGKVTGLKSGAVVAGKNLRYGIEDGFTDLVREPLEGGRRGGALGALKGMGKGSISMISKVSSGAIGLVAYPGQGIRKSISAAMPNAAQRSIDRARLEEGRYLAANEGDECERMVLQAFDRYVQS